MASYPGDFKTIVFNKTSIFVYETSKGPWQMTIAGQRIWFAENSIKLWADDREKTFSDTVGGQ